MLVGRGGSSWEGACSRRSSFPCGPGVAGVDLGAESRCLDSVSVVEDGEEE